MARVKGGFTARRRHNKVLKLTKGQFGARHKHIRKAKEASLHAQAYATHDRRLERREIRKLWILRINAAARINGTTYSKLISALKVKGIELNRKSLAELASRDSDAFAALVKEAQAA